MGLELGYRWFVSAPWCPGGGHECGEGRWEPSKPVAVVNVGYSVLECRGEDGCCLPQCGVPRGASGHREGFDKSHLSPVSRARWVDSPSGLCRAGWGKGPVRASAREDCCIFVCMACEWICYAARRLVTNGGAQRPIPCDTLSIVQTSTRVPL